VETRETILVVEDSLIWQTKLKRLLEREYYTVETARRYNEALDKVRSGSFDLVIIDLSLVPGDPDNRDGMKLARHVVDMGIPAIVLTAYLTPDDSRQAFQHGVFDVVTKQAFTEGFRGIVRRALAQRL
jgi:CheY-like chemotaxis protein